MGTQPKNRRVRLKGGGATIRQLLMVAHALEERGLAIASVCAEAGLPQQFFSQGLDGATAPEQEAALHDLCARHQPDPDFLFHVARQAPLGAYSLVELPLVSSSTLIEVEEVLGRAWREPGSRVESSRSAGVLSVRVHDERPTTGRWLLKLGTWVRLLETLALPLIRVALPLPGRTALRFAHIAPTVSSGSPFLEFVLDAHSKPRSGNGYLHQASLAWLQDRAPHALEDRIRAEVRVALQDGDEVGVGAIADRLGLSVRTLQRRLGAAGIAYRQLIRDVRLSWASALLEDHDLQVSQIASKLGFAASSSFDRSFRSWAGVTPTEWRVRQARARIEPRPEPDGAIDELALAADRVPLDPLVVWIEARDEADPAMASLGRGWLAVVSGAVLDAQRHFTDALRLLAGQRRAVATTHALRALGELYLAAGESWSAEVYLQSAIAFGSGLVPGELWRARQLDCLLRVRANRVHLGLRALGELEGPRGALSSACFSVRSAAVLIEAGQFESGVALLAPAADSNVAAATHRDLLRMGSVLIRHGRPRLLRRVLPLLAPLLDVLPQAASAHHAFLMAAANPRDDERLELLHGVPHGQLDPFTRVEALHESLLCARENGADASTWQERHDAAGSLADNVRTSLRAGEVRSFHAVEFARGQLLASR